MAPGALPAVVVAGVLRCFRRSDSSRRSVGARSGYESVLPVADPGQDGSYRILWIGHPDNLPAQGHAFVADMAWVATLDGLPDIIERSLPADVGASAQIDAVLEAIVAGDTARAGRLFGGLGIRYVVTVERLAPAPFSAAENARPVPAALVETLDTQLDLRRLSGVNSALRVYENMEWVAVRAAAAAGFDAGRDDLFDLQVSPLAGTIGVLVGDGDEITGPIPNSTEIFVGQTPDVGWEFEVDGVAAAERRSLGWATAYVPASGGDATLRYRTPRWRQLVVIVQLLAVTSAAGLQLRRATGGRS